MIILFGILVIVNVSTKTKSKKLTTEECEEIIDDIIQNKTISIIKKSIENCKQFVALSILFVSISIILSGIIIYFCIKSRNKDIFPYQNHFKKKVDSKLKQDFEKVHQKRLHQKRHHHFRSQFFSDN